MFTPSQDQDDRKRAPRGIVLSVAERPDGSLRLSIDRVDATGTTLPNEWRFKVFDGHLNIDQSDLDKIYAKMYDSINVDEAAASLGHALLVDVLAEAIEARKRGPV